MKITEIQIMPVKPRDGLVAFASVVVDNALYLSSIGVYTRLSGAGWRITYPTKKSGDKSFNIYHPINKEASQAIERAVLDKMQSLLQKGSDFYE